MKKHSYTIYTLVLLFTLLQLTSCVLDDPMDEYDAVGAVGTISSIAVSNTSPEAGENVTFDVTFYSEHEAATSLRMNLLAGEDITLLEEITFDSWELNDSRLEQFVYSVPADAAAGEAFVIQFAIETVSGYINTTTRTLTVPAPAEDA